MMNPIADENPFDTDHLSAEEKLRNVAKVVLRYTERNAYLGGKGRSGQYAAPLSVIAPFARQLAEYVLAYLEER